MTTSFTVEPMQPDEATPVIGLLRSVVSALPFYNDAAKQAELALYTDEYLRALAQHDANGVLVAKVADTVIGLCVSRHDDGPVWLSWYMADPAWQGRGVGQALLGALFAARKAEGVHKIWCDSRTDNHGSRAVMQRAGFRELCTLERHWHGQDYVLLERFLD